MENQSTYRIRTKLGEEKPINIPLHLTQEYNSFEILSLKVNTNDTYRSYTSTEGIVVGRVSTANNGLGIPNVRVSIFVPKGTYEQTDEEEVLYPFSSPTDLDGDRVRYNLLPSDSDVECYQVIGTLPTKRKILDNETVLDVFDKYYKYTTVTNEAGDFMLSNIPVGKQRLHIDADLSDIGPFLSQRPYDMIENLGFEENKFESTRQFKGSKDLDSLAQVISQNKSVYVYPYWGDATENGAEMKITRTDLSLNYEFITSAIFIGSVITDKQSNSIRQNCTATENAGKMADMITGPGRIEMIRKTVDNKIEQYRVKGDMLINDNGVWCYQVPMNLDYVRTDEFGNIIPTDDPNKGVPTRARVRFRITLNEMESDEDAHKRCSYLVPNNPKTDDERFLSEDSADYSFGSDTWDESFVDMLWNKVYTVKNYIPQIQKSTRPTNRKHTGIKMTNHYGDNNPFPYNGLTIKLSFQYRLICVIVKIIIALIGFLNNIISILGAIPCWLANISILGVKPFKSIKKYIPNCIELSSEFCDDGINKNVYYPGCGKPFSCVWDEVTKPDCAAEQKAISDSGGEAAVCTNSGQELYTCVENELAQSNEATSFNFSNDWINGCLYMPLWYRKIKPKKSYFFGLFKRKAKDQWCAGEKGSGSQSAKIAIFCGVNYNGIIESQNYKGEDVEYRKMNNDFGCESDCHETKYYRSLNDGVIMNLENSFGQTVWYYKAVETDTSTKNGFANEYLNSRDIPMVSKTLFATDIVLLGSMNDCDQNGIPKFFNYLKASTFNLPTDILFSDTDISYSLDEDGNVVDQSAYKLTVASGGDWGNKNEYGLYDGGLFYSIGCSSIRLEPSSCINLKRICEIGIGLDEAQYVDNIDVEINSDTDVLDYNNGEEYYLRPDGFISYDDINDFNYRSMFATMNGNSLRTKINTSTGVYEYDFRHLYIDNFDGSLYDIMARGQRDGDDGISRGKHTEANYFYNYNLEQTNLDYLTFRMGDNPYYYDGKSLVAYDKNNGSQEYHMPKYENSFYFYFGLKEGKTAIDLFNEKYNGPCTTNTGEEESIPYEKQSNSWCNVDSDKDGSYDHSEHDGYLKINFENITTPYSAILNSKDNSGVTYTFLAEYDYNSSTSISEEKVGFCGKDNTDVLDGYTQIYLLYENSSLATPLTHEEDGEEKDGVLCYVPSNGEYTLTVVDGEGNQYSFDINLKTEYLVFDDVENTFAQPNNVLEKYFEVLQLDGKDAPYLSVAKTPSSPNSTNLSIVGESSGEPYVERQSNANEDGGLKVRTDEEVKLDGTICIYNVYYKEEPLDIYTIEVKCADTDEIKEDGDLWWYTYDEIKMFFDSSTTAKYKLYDYSDDGNYIEVSGTNSPYFYTVDDVDINGVDVVCHVIKCPKGGVNYNVRVTQICKADGKYKKTQNIVQRKVYVGEPASYKLYINDIDYDIIKNFKTGWELKSNYTLQTDGKINVTITNPYLPFDGVGDVSNIKGWLNISDVNNTSYSWEEEKEKYGTSSDTFYKNDDGRYEIDVDVEELENSLPTEPVRSDFDSDSEYNDAYSEWFEEYQELEEELAEMKEKAQILANRLEFIDKMKSAFWIQEEDTEKYITYVVQTDDTPYDVWTLYNAEAESQSDDDYNETESDADGGRNSWIYTSESEMTISGSKIPNITSYDSNDFGIAEDSTRVNSFPTTYGAVTYSETSGTATVTSGTPNGIAFAQDNIAENSKDSGSISIKPPYIVACINNAGVTKPENLVNGSFYGVETNSYGITTYKFGPNAEGNKGYISDGNNQFFQFYLLDKIFSPDIVMWSYLNNVPYFIPWLAYDLKPSDYSTTEDKEFAAKLGMMVKTYGILSGNILNGITDDSETLSDFDEKKIFSTDVSLKTYENDTEDSIPTRRCILYSDTLLSTLLSGGNLTYVNYRHVVETEIENTNQYRLVPNMSGKLEFSDKDSSASTSRTLYGSMCVTLQTTTLNACDTSFYENDDTSLTLRVSVSNGDTDKPITYYIFKVNKDGKYNQTNREVFYPVNAFSITSNGFSLECEDKTNSWSWGTNKTDASQFFNKNTLESDFLDKNNPTSTSNLCDFKLSSQVERYNSAGETEYDDTNGYGNTGVFTELEHSPYFVVATTENNCRTVSPVYDFTMVYYGMQIVSVGSQMAIRVWLEDVINSNNIPNNYYLTQFDFTINYTIESGENQISSGDITYYYSSVNIEKSYDSEEEFGSDTDYFNNLDVGESVSVTKEDGTYDIHTKTGGTINVSEEEITVLEYTGTDLPKTYWYQTSVVDDTTGDVEDRYAIITINADGTSDTTILESGVKPDADIEEFTEGESVHYYTDGVSYYKITLELSYDSVENVSYDPTIPYFEKYYDKILTDKEADSFSSLFNSAAGSSSSATIFKNQLNQSMKFYVTDVTGLRHRAKLQTVVKTDG